jgi:hypothetical protein
VKKFKASLNVSDQLNALKKISLSQFKTTLNKSKSNAALLLKMPQVLTKNTRMLFKSIDYGGATPGNLNSQSEFKNK